MVKLSEMADPSAIPAKCTGDSHPSQTPLHMLFLRVGRGSSPLSYLEICHVFGGNNYMQKTKSTAQ